MNIKCNELIEFLVNKSLQLSQNDPIYIDLREIKDILFFSNESIFDSVSQIRQEKFYYLDKCPTKVRQISTRV